MLLTALVYITEFVVWTYHLMWRDQDTETRSSVDEIDTQLCLSSEFVTDDPLLAQIVNSGGETLDCRPKDAPAAGEAEDMASWDDGYYNQRNNRGRGRGRGANHPLLQQQDPNLFQQGGYRYRPQRGRGYSHQPAATAQYPYHQQAHDMYNPPVSAPLLGQLNHTNVRSAPAQMNMNISTAQYNSVPQQASGSASNKSNWKPTSAVNSSHPTHNAAYDELYELETLWKQKNNRAVVTHLKNYLNRSPTPYTDCLDMLSSCADLREMKTVTLAFNITKEFNHWISSHRNKADIEPLTEDLQQRALHVATGGERNVMGQFLDNIVDGFKLRDVSYMAHPFCKKLLLNNKFKVGLIITS